MVKYQLILPFSFLKNLAVFQTHADTHTERLTHMHHAAGQSVPKTKAVSDAERRVKIPWKFQWARRSIWHVAKKLNKSQPSSFFSFPFVLKINSDDKIS